MLTLPTTLNDRYRLVEQLGVGGLADVYRAEDLVLEREVAVKVVRGATTDDDQPFAKEIAALARLSHPGIIRLYDGGTHAGTAYLVMEFVEGRALDEVIATEAPFDADRVCAIGQQVAEALAHAHGVGLVHRDVKPPNILLEDSGRARLTDFGIARVIDETLTSSNLGLGTAGYLAPEQVESGRVGPRADIYSLGLVLLECLTGERAFPGTLTESTIARLHRDPPIPEALPAPWRQLLRDMTHRDPDVRPGAAALATRLRRRGDLGDGAVPGTAPDTTRTVTLGKRPGQGDVSSTSRWVAAAAVALLVAAGVLLSGEDPLADPGDAEPVAPGADGEGEEGAPEEVPTPETLGEALELLERAVGR